ncbi:MAG: PAS domain S-box protein, partial [Deltaproteobacteria bacterium]
MNSVPDLHDRYDRQSLPSHEREKSNSEGGTGEISRLPGQKNNTGLYILQAGLFSYVDRRFASVLGYDDPEALVGKSFWEVAHPDDQKLVTEEIMRREDELAVNPPVFRLLDKNKKIVWVHMRGSAMMYCGKPAHIGCLIDASPFGSLIKSLQESLERYETILDDVDIHLGELDLEGNMSFINDAGCRMWKLPRERLIGLPSRSYMDPETQEKITAIYRQVFRTGVPVKNIIIDVASVEGGKRTIETSVSLTRDAEGKITGFRNVTRDITDRKEAEKRLAEHRSRLEAIFGSVKDAIITVDPGLAVIDANKSTESICSIAVKDI